MLGSGSAGNSALVATDHCKILVDGGLPPQSVTRTFAVTPLATQRFQGVSLRRRGHSRRYQAPRARQTRAVRRVDENIVVEIPDRCLAGAGSVEHIVRVAIAVKVGCRHQRPAGWKCWAVHGADINVVVKIPDRGLPGVHVVEHIVRVAVAVKVSYSYQCPASPKCWAEHGADINVVVKIPDRCSIVTSLEQGIIRMAVLTKICRTPQAPARSKSRAVQGVDENVVIEVPYRCLPGAGITEHIIRVAIAIEVAYGSPAPQADFHKCGLTISDSEVPCLRRKRGIRDCIGVRTRCQHRIVRAVSKRCTISHAV